MEEIAPGCRQGAWTMCVCNHSQLFCTSLSVIATVSCQLQLKILCKKWKYVQLIEFDAWCDTLPRHLWGASSGSNGTGQTVWRPRSSVAPVWQPAGPGPLLWCHRGCCTILVTPLYVWKRQHTTMSCTKKPLIVHVFKLYSRNYVNEKTK